MGTRKLLLEKAGVQGIRGYDVYRREGGYAAVEKALKTMTPDQVTANAPQSMENQFLVSAVLGDE